MCSDTMRNQAMFDLDPTIREYCQDVGVLTIGSDFERRYAQAYSAARRAGLSADLARAHGREAAAATQDGPKPQAECFNPVLREELRQTR